MMRRILLPWMLSSFSFSSPSRIGHAVSSRLFKLKRSCDIDFISGVLRIVTDSPTKGGVICSSACCSLPGGDGLSCACETLKLGGVNDPEGASVEGVAVEVVFVEELPVVPVLSRRRFSFSSDSLRVNAAVARIVLLVTSE